MLIQSRYQCGLFLDVAFCVLLLATNLHRYFCGIQSYDRLNDRFLIYKTSYKEWKAFLKHDLLAEL